MTDTPAIPPAAKRLQAIIAPLLQSHKHAVEAAEGTEDGMVLVDGAPVAIAIKRLQRLAQDMIDGSEDAPPVFGDQKPPLLVDIAKQCGAVFGVSMERMKMQGERVGPNPTTKAKRAFVYLARKLNNEKKPYSMIGKVVGLTDHTSAMQAHKFAMTAMECDRDFYVRVRDAERRLMSNG